MPRTPLKMDKIGPISFHDFVPIGITQNLLHFLIFFHEIFRIDAKLDFFLNILKRFLIWAPNLFWGQIPKILARDMNSENRNSWVITVREKSLNHDISKQQKRIYIGQLTCYGLEIWFVASLYDILQKQCSDFEHFEFWPFYCWKTAKK